MWVTRKDWNAAKAAQEALLQELAKIQDAAILIGIEREDRLNKFTFVRNGHVHQIETYSTMGDDLPGWKENLLR